MDLAQNTNVLKTIAPAQRRPVSGLRFDWLLTFLASWVVGGLYLDGWAHRHGQTDTGFFTIWHAALYSGFLTLGIVLIVSLVRNRQAGFNWSSALSAGYNLSLLGAAIFLVGGLIDMVWHILLGVEVSVEALLSPSHLLLALGSALMVSGSLRAAWLRTNTSTDTHLATLTLANKLLPAIFSTALLLSVITFFAQYGNILVYPWAARTSDLLNPLENARIELGLVSVLVHAALYTGLALLLARRWQLPFGTFIVIFTLNAALLSLLTDQYWSIITAFLSGLIADVGLQVLQPFSFRSKIKIQDSAPQVSRLRLFAFGLPALMLGVYFVNLTLTARMAWSVSLWGGAILLAGIVGLFVSYLVVPPVAPDETQLS